MFINFFSINNKMKIFFLTLSLIKTKGYKNNDQGSSTIIIKI